ncbi:alpha/beta fold hydrolase [Crocosphaera sp. XPORK-15E]|uniref:alpha/beta fold hydrolase n=1 Tax=Crocosphaera sp. XPORK-15E TaxID=3110247 RepID=UPI002B21F55F|nr:alpha/beta fold hydrolase [Crocosphaera sp. XPORK-15E]MEA5536474.1 alpha/beta fold hydrolase [Crocosphaera sp. XPORK-15E]
MSYQQPWEMRIGRQRDWIWRGWPIRYTFLPSGAGKLTESQPSMILLHGFGAAIEHWRHNMPILAQDYRVYALDLLGFGGSKKAAADYTIDLWVEQIHDFWQTFIGKPVILVGNSIGSLVCLTAASKYPEMVASIVMLSLPDVSLRQEMIPKVLRPIINTIEGLFAPPLLLKGLFNIIRRPQIIRPWIGLAYYDKSAVTDELVDIIAIPPQDEGAARAFCLLFEGLRKPGYAPVVKDVLPDFKIPILLVWGRQDRLVPFSLAAQFAQLNPKITLVELDHAGHCPHDECPDRFNSILLDWLKLVNY